MCVWDENVCVVEYCNKPTSETNMIMKTNYDLNRMAALQITVFFH